MQSSNIFTITVLLIKKIKRTDNHFNIRIALQTKKHITEFSHKPNLKIYHTLINIGERARPLSVRTKERKDYIKRREYET